ncbi:DNA polymerase III subunit gamma/tau, partial [Candidatus Saccharibacteria bacterium]|nr:DNA polymerase III subunit gamma/tau [Candidatus Saccharibacteria bacterium]
MPSSPKKTLYRKYRPTTLNDVVAQDGVMTPLKNALKSGRFSHAYLFTGPRGTGNTTVARIFAHEV